MELPAAVALGLIVWLTYGNSLANGFTLDSTPIILGASHVHAASWENVAQILSRDYWWPGSVTGTYRPVTTLSYLLNYAILGNAEQPAGYHWVNLALHWLNALLVQAVCRRAAGLARRPAFLVAVLFTTHPVGPEAVTNIVGRADLLAAAAVLGGLLLHLRAIAAHGLRRAGWLAALAATAGLGLLSKESAVSVVGVIVVYDLALRFRTPRRGGLVALARAVLGIGWPSWGALVAPFVAVWALRSWVQASGGVLPPDYGWNSLIGLGFWHARLTAFAVLGRSLMLLAWPQQLCPDYSVAEILPFGEVAWGWDAARVLAAIGAIGAIGAVLGVTALQTRRDDRSGRAALFFIGFFLVTWLPTSNVFFLIGSTMAERFLYLPQVGPLACLVLGVETLVGALAARLGTASRARRLAPGALAWLALGLIAVAYGVRARERNGDWQSDLTLWSAAVESCPRSYRSHQGLAAALAASDTSSQALDRAIAEAESAHAILERHAPPGTRVPAVVLENLGAFYLRKSEALRPQRGVDGIGAVASAEARAWARKAADALEQTVAWYAELAEQLRKPQRVGGDGGGEPLQLGVASVYENLGWAELGAGRPEQARDAFLRQRGRRPGDAAAYAGLASAETALGRFDEALVSAMQELLLEPERTEVPPALLDLYRRVDPGGCAFVARDGGYTIDPECPAARRYACRAYEGIGQAFVQSPALDAPARAAAVQAVRQVAAETFDCAVAASPGG